MRCKCVVVVVVVMVSAVVVLCVFCLNVKTHANFDFSVNYAKLSDEGPAGPKNLSWKSKNVQSGATPCMSTNCTMTEETRDGRSWLQVVA